MFDHRHLAAALESVSSVPAEPSAAGIEGGIDGEGLAREGFAAYRCADPRRRIFDAMIETVAHRGYDLTTIERVLSAAQVPAPVFDEHFETKQECFLQTLDALIARFEQTLAARVPGPGRAPWPERIRLGLETLLGELADHPDSARVALVECLSAPEAAVARLHRALARLAAVLDEGRAQAAGRDGADIGCLPPQISTAVVGGIASIVHRRVLENQTAELPELLPELLYFALMPYLGHAGAIGASGLSAAREPEETAA
jgi:AcrR family transcriptional regulator